MARSRILHIEHQGQHFDWFDLDQQEQRGPLSEDFVHILRENIAHYFHVPYDQQAIFDEFGLLCTPLDFQRAFKCARPYFFVHDMWNMPPELREKTLQQLNLDAVAVQRTQHDLGRGPRVSSVPSRPVSPLAPRESHMILEPGTTPPSPVERRTSLAPVHIQKPVVGAPLPVAVSPLRGMAPPMRPLCSGPPLGAELPGPPFAVMTGPTIGLPGPCIQPAVGPCLMLPAPHLPPVQQQAVTWRMPMANMVHSGSCNGSLVATPQAPPPRQPPAFIPGNAVPRQHLQVLEPSVDSSGAMTATAGSLVDVFLNRESAMHYFGFTNKPDIAHGGLVITKIEEGGILACWNLDNPAQAVHMGDVIMSVNNAKDDPEAMQDKLRNSTLAHMRIMRMRGA